MALASTLPNPQQCHNTSTIAKDVVATQPKPSPCGPTILAICTAQQALLRSYQLEAGKRCVHELYYTAHAPGITRGAALATHWQHSLIFFELQIMNAGPCASQQQQPTQSCVGFPVHTTLTNAVYNIQRQPCHLEKERRERSVIISSDHPERSKNDRCAWSHGAWYHGAHHGGNQLQQGESILKTSRARAQTGTSARWRRHRCELSVPQAPAKQLPDE